LERLKILTAYKIQKESIVVVRLRGNDQLITGMDVRKAARTLPWLRRLGRRYIPINLDPGKLWIGGELEQNCCGLKT